MAKNRHQFVSAFSLFSKSYDVVMRNFKNFAILLFLPFIASISSAANQRSRGSDGKLWEEFNYFSTSAPVFNVVGFIGVGLLLFLLGMFVILVIQAALYTLQLEGAQGKTPKIKHLLQSGLKHWVKLLGLALMIGLYIVGLALVGAIPILILRNAFGFAVGFLWLLAVVLFIYQRYFLSPYILIDKKMPVLETMELSAKYAKNYAGPIWAVIGVSILLGFSGVVPLLGPILSFVLGAIYSVAPALRYEEIKKLS